MNLQYKKLKKYDCVILAYKLSQYGFGYYNIKAIITVY